MTDYRTQGIYRDGEFISCSSPKFNEFIPFHYDNIAELKAEIEKVSKKKKFRKVLLKAQKDLEILDPLQEEEIHYELDQILTPSHQ